MKQNKMERTLPRESRPYEKLEEKGAAALTNQELLAVFLRTGTRTESVLDLAGKILEASLGNSLGGMCAMTLSQWKEIRGIGRVKALQLMCLCELSRRIVKEKKVRGLSYLDPASVAAYYMEDFRHKDHEELVVLLLNNKNQLLAQVMVSRGMADEVRCSPREIFIEALRYKAVHLILLHNHPSGDPTASESDIGFTRRIFTLGEMIGIPLLDHIIIGDCCYTSLREQGILSI